MRILTLVICLIFLSVSLNLLAQVIPDSLRVDWSGAGYQGTIPSPSLIINVKKFGAYGDSSHDDYTAVINAINSSSQLRVIYFPAGKYLIQSTLQLPSNVVLRGDGNNATNLCFSLTSGNCINISSAQVNTFINIDSGYIKGSNIIYVSNASLLNAGSYAEIKETNGAWNVVPASWAANCVGQIVKIVSIQNDSVTIDAPLRITYTKDLQPQIRLINPVQNTGVECMKITRLDSTPNNYGYNINFSYAENCWVTGVESNKSQGSHILLNTSSHVTVSGCYFHDAFTYDGVGTAGYGVTLIQHTSDCKIENSVFRHLRHSMVAKQGANGNVFGYNYSFDPNRTEFPSDGGGDLLLHGHYAFANLFEGNICQNIIIDQSWGPSGPCNTFFRNRALLYGIGIIDTTVASVQENFVGNEITNSGIANGYPMGSYYLNPNTEFTYANNVRGNILPAGTNTLTDSSYYLTAKPYYWDTDSSWPSVGIPNTINTSSNPAMTRYLSGNATTSCTRPISLTVSLTADSILCNGGLTNINAKASGGTGAYQYSIDGINFQPGNTFSKTAGSYTIFAVDAANDTASTKISISQPSIIKASLKKINLTCYNDSSGSITITASGGINPYMYNLNGGTYQTINVFKNLKAVAYVVTVKDKNNCIINVPSASLTQPAVISISNVVKSVSCKNASDGSITVTASKGTSPYQYSLNGGNYQSSNMFTGLPAGSYVVKVLDAKGCVIIAKTSAKVNNSTKVCATSTTQSDKDFDAKVFPNPSQTKFSLNIVSSSADEVSISITDLYGRNLNSIKGTVNQTFDIGSKFAAGIYIIKVTQGKNLKVLKIIKQ